MRASRIRSGHCSSPSTASETDLAPGSAELARLTDAYLEPFTARLPAARLRSMVPLARWSAMVGRALTWRAALLYATPSELGEWASAVPGWLRELASGVPLT